MVFQDIGQHISHQFDEDLESLRSKVLNMGGMVEKQVENALIALTRSDSSLAEDVATSDYKINSMEIAIEAFPWFESLGSRIVVTLRNTLVVKFVRKTMAIFPKASPTEPRK